MVFHDIEDLEVWDYLNDSDRGLGLFKVILRADLYPVCSTSTFIH